MKKLIAMTAAIVISSAVIEAHAVEPANCEEISGLSKSVMHARQDGIGMVKVMEVAEGFPLMEEMVIAAYDQPAYSTPEIQRRTIRDFADEWYLACIKARR